MAWSGGFHLNLSHLSGGGSDGRSSDRESPVSSRSKKPATSRFASEDQKKTPRSTSCDVASGGIQLLSPKRRKEKGSKGDAGTPRSGRKKVPTPTSGRASVEKRLLSNSRAEHKSPNNVTRMASPLYGGARTSREERRSPGTRLSQELGKRPVRKKKSGRGEHTGHEVETRVDTARDALSRDGHEIARDTPSNDAEEQESLKLTPEIPDLAASASGELRRLHQYIEQTISYGAPATTVLQLLDECIVCTTSLSRAVADLPAESQMLQRDLKDLCHIRQSAGNSHPDPSLTLISLNRVMAVAEHLKPPTQSPEWRTGVTESPPLQPFELHALESKNGKESPLSGKASPLSGKESPAMLTISGHGVLGAGVMVSEGPPDAIHMTSAHQSKEPQHEDELCPVHFRKLKQGEAAPELEQRENKKDRDRGDRGRSSSEDFSDCSTCSSDAEIRSMNRHLQALHSPRNAFESPPDFLNDIFTRLSMESGRHFDGLDAPVVPSDPQAMDAFTEHVPRGFSSEELLQIAEKQLLELVVPQKAYETLQCNVCMGKLLSFPNAMSPDEDDSSSDSEDSDCGRDCERQKGGRECPLLTKLPCKHIFHDTCIEKWFFFGRSCPICRNSILPSERQPEPEPTPQLLNSTANAPIPDIPEEPADVSAEHEGPDQMQRMIFPINPIEQPPLAVPTRQRQMIRVPALPLHTVRSASEHSTPRTPSAPNSARLPMSPRSAFTDIKSHRSTTESDATPRSEPAYNICTPRSAR